MCWRMGGGGTQRHTGFAFAPSQTNSNNWTYFPKTWTDWISGMIAINVLDELIVRLDEMCCTQARDHC